MIQQAKISDLKNGMTLDLGITSLSEKEIIEFAKRFDPLYFHIDKEAAKKSIFKDLVASGPHLFTKVHREEWISRFGHTVLAGLEISNWKFLKPVYADQPISCQVTVVDIKKNPVKYHAVIRWRYDFKDMDGEPVQVVEAVVLHKIE